MDTNNQKTQATTAGTHRVVLLRHAQSLWNAENRFTGWADPPLTELGIAEAQAAGPVLARCGFEFDRVYSSLLERARHTAELVLAEQGSGIVPEIRQDWRLNERHYGALQGADKSELAAAAGDEQVWRWRRAYRERPPVVTEDDPRHPRFDPRYTGLNPERLPGGESLADTRSRVAGFWRDVVRPQLTDGRRVLISAHGNSLRALLMLLDGMSVEQIEGFEIPTGTPIVYRFDHPQQPAGWSYLQGADPVGKAA